MNNGLVSSCLSCGGNRIQNSECSCPLGFYEPSFPDAFCAKCHSSCYACNSGSSSNQCLACKDN
jgi:hypothetical protein